jgi:hypothetical protein
MACFSRRRVSTSSGTSPCTRPPSANTSLISRELMLYEAQTGIMERYDRRVERQFISAI